MYIILDNHLKRIGTLSNQDINGTPFYNDQITQQIADDDSEIALGSLPDNLTAYDPNGNSKNWGHTLDQIYVPYGYPDTDKIQEGNSLAYQDPNNHRWYVMRLTSVTDATDDNNSGAHYKEATGINLCIWKLGKTVHYAETLPQASSREAFSALFGDTGWFFNPDSPLVGGSADIQFDGTSSNQAMLQQLCQIYGAEIDAYVLFPNARKAENGHSYYEDFNIAEKKVDIVRRLGEDRGDRVVYGRNATNIQRTIVDDNLYTRLYVYGQKGATCACDITNNEPYVEDKVANEIYNPAIGDNSENFLEGVITSQTVSDPIKLAQWGLKQLKIFNHPRANYTIGVSNLMNSGQGNKEVMNANLGDTYRVIDYKMQPVLTVKARVIRKTLSFADPRANTITLGEYTTVNVVPPNFIQNLQQGQTNKINEILDEIRRNPGALTGTIDMPNGCTWHFEEPQKKFIAHIYVLGEEITNLIQSKGFIWQLIQDGQPNTAFAQKHINDGQVLTIQNDLKINGQSVATTTAQVAAKNNSENDEAQVNGISFNLYDNAATDGTNDIVGTVKLMIDTDYISNQQAINFNTNRIKHLFTIGEWKDHWGDPRVGAFQYVNYNPEQDNYYASLVYYGRWRPRQPHKDSKTGPINGSMICGDENYDSNKHDPIVNRLSHSEIARLDSSGNYQDSMIIIFSHHNSNFGLDYQSAGGPYIWTTIQDYPSGQDYWLVRIPYQSNKIFKLSELNIQSNPQISTIPNNDKILELGQDGVFANYDPSSNIILISHDDTTENPQHTVDFYHVEDLLNNRQNAKPFQSIDLVDYGFVPKTEDYSLTNDMGNTYGPQDDSSQQTYQSCCLHYPYFFFDSGNVNMSDPRMIYCIDIRSKTKIFGEQLDMNEFNLNTVNKMNGVIGSNPGNVVIAEPETINVTHNSKGELVFLYGLNCGFANDKSGSFDYTNEGLPVPDLTHYEELFEVGMDINNDKTNTNNEQDNSENGAPQI